MNPAGILRRAARESLYFAAELRYRLIPPSLTDADYDRELTESPERPVLRHRLPPAELRAALEEIRPGAVADLLREADALLGHEINLLGSGPVQLPDPIDWHVDFKSGHRFDPRNYYRRVRPAPYPGGYDVKVPWELSRCHHLVRLAQAYYLAHDERYAAEAVQQIRGWIAANPWPFGVNWTSTMDVAIRAVNWLWVLDLLDESTSLDAATLREIDRSLLIHGRHIAANLEDWGEGSNNHLLADLVGLLFLGLLRPQLREAADWRRIGAHFWNELLRQTYPDGGSFEGSTSYHRLVSEMALAAQALCRLNLQSVPENAAARIEAMVDFLSAIKRPDGSIPLIGDADDGRLLPLGEHAALWTLGKAQGRRLVAPTPRAFPDSGLYVFRDGNSHLVFNVGSSSPRAPGGHRHNDALSIDLWSHGQHWLVDPGTYVYTADYETRDLFRSTGYHSTVGVVGREQRGSEPRRIFDASVSPSGVVLAIDLGGDVEVVRAELRHRDVVHTRTVTFRRGQATWQIQDDVVPGDASAVEVSFHYAPGLDVEVEGVDLIARCGGATLRLETLDEVGRTWSIRSAYASRSYGRRTPSKVAVSRAGGRLRFSLVSEESATPRGS